MTDDRSTVDERAQGGELGELDEALEAHDYPTSSDELVGAYGDYAVESAEGSRSVEEIFSPIDDETYGSADEVRDRVLELVHRE